jgi:hypothetical protein
MRRSRVGKFAWAALLIQFAAAGAPAAEADLFGFWNHLGDFAGFTAGGPPLGDYSFLPLNEQAIARAEAWDPAIQTQVQRQCFPHSAAWAPFGPTPLQVIRGNGEEAAAIVIRMQSNEVYRVIWMDGRPHPSARALHTWNGFSTGEWVGTTLKITTTHIKEGFTRRNGVPNSDRSRVTEYLTRHDDYLTDVIVLQDPVYLHAPLVREQSYRRLPDNTEMLEYPCEPSLEEAGGRLHFTPHFLPGRNPHLAKRTRRADEFRD